MIDSSHEKRGSGMEARFRAFQQAYEQQVPNATFSELSAAWNIHLREVAIPAAISSAPRLSPIRGCGEIPPTGGEILRLIELDVDQLDKGTRQNDLVRYAFSTHLNTATMVLMEAQPKKTGAPLTVSRYSVRIEQVPKTSKYAILSTKDSKVLSAIDAWAVVRTWAAPSLSSDKVVVNDSLIARAYNNRSGCTIQERAEKMRMLMIDELRRILGKRSDPIEWLRGNGELLSTTEQHAQLMLYLWIKTAHLPDGERRDIINISETRLAFQRIYAHLQSLAATQVAI